MWLVRQRPSRASPSNPHDSEPSASAGQPAGASRPVVPLLVPNSQARPLGRITAFHAAYANFAGTLGLSSRRHGFEFRWGTTLFSY